MAKKFDPVKAKAAKQKKIAIGGAVLLVLLLAVEVPKTMKRMHGSGGADWRTAQPAPPDATAAPPTGLAVPTLAGGNPAAPAATTTQEGPLASETAPTAAVGQLASFGRFASKDPFASQAPTTPTATTPPTPPTPPTTPSSDGSVPGAPGAAVPGSTPAAPPTAVLTSAVIEVNKIKSLVTVNSDFPASTDPNMPPVFHLKSVTAHSAKVSIAGGTYSNGAPSITLQEGKPVTLMNTADGTRYTLVLWPQGTDVSSTTTGATPAPSAPAPAAPASTTTSSTTTTTATTTTTKSGG
jgi:hypothetical protein